MIILCLPFSATAQHHESPKDGILYITGLDTFDEGKKVTDVPEKSTQYLLTKSKR